MQLVMFVKISQNADLNLIQRHIRRYAKIQPRRDIHGFCHVLKINHAGDIGLTCDLAALDKLVSCAVDRTDFDKILTRKSRGVCVFSATCEKTYTQYQQKANKANHASLSIRLFELLQDCEW